MGSGGLIGNRHTSGYRPVPCGIDDPATMQYPPGDSRPGVCASIMRPVTDNPWNRVPMRATVRGIRQMPVRGSRPKRSRTEALWIQLQRGADCFRETLIK